METVILGIVGVVLSLVFSYVPVAREWLEKQDNKGLIMLALVMLVSAAYFALSCSPFAADLGIKLQCSRSGLFDLLQAIFIIASGNQLAFLYSKAGKPLG